MTAASPYAMERHELIARIIVKFPDLTIDQFAEVIKVLRTAGLQTLRELLYLYQPSDEIPVYLGRISWMTRRRECRHTAGRVS